MVFGILIFLNVIASFKFGRIDLTSDKRHSLKGSTIELLTENSELNDVVYVKIYLGGELPGEFDKLRTAVKEKLDEIRVYAGDKIEYDIINLFEVNDPKAEKEILEQLEEKGMRPIVGEVVKKGSTTRQIIVPEAEFIYKNKTIPVPLIKLNTTKPSPESIHAATLNLEFIITSTIRRLITVKRPTVAFLEGHEELDRNETIMIENNLKEYYDVKRLTIENKLRALDTVDVLIIAKPKNPFQEKEKFVIDQFIMRGGKVMWLIDPVDEHIDTLYAQGTTLGLKRNLNLKDQLFKYGVRISNHNIVIDKKCAPVGSPLHRKVVWWNFFPLLDPSDPNSGIDITHPIINNIDPIKTEYASAIELVESPGVIKTPLLKSSDKTVLDYPPVRIDFRFADINNEDEKYAGVNNKPYQTIGVLLEGSFTSVYKNRLAPEFQERIQKDSVGYEILSESVPNKMLVVGDGDIIKNAYRGQNVQGQMRYMHLPIEINEYGNVPEFSGLRYGNKDFILNAVDYMLGDQTVIASRSRKTVRKLDTERVKKERTFWQVANLAIPTFLVILFGIAQYFIRRMKYQR